MTIRQNELDLRAEVEALKNRLIAAERRSRVTCGLAMTVVTCALFVSPGNRAAFAQGYGITLQQLAARLTTLESKTQFMSADTTAKSTTFSGCNVYIQNGLGATNGNPGNPLDLLHWTTNGLGNLVIGYDYAGRGFTDPNTGQFVATNVRTGSHNLILGDMNDYSSYGGIVAGYFNTLTGGNSVITGGEFNTSSGILASINGGTGNNAIANSSTISGGQSNTVTSGANNESISGGYNNTVSGYAASVSGGQRNTAGQNFASVSGGLGITQSNFFGWSAGNQGGTNFSGNFTSP
jgi:hypothetical protein